MTTLKRKLEALSQADIYTLIEKGETYGDSWKKRGGVGAAMMLARKWDRIEVALKEHGYDIFKAIARVDYLVDDIQDLGCYLWLVRSEGLMVEDIPKYPLQSGELERAMATGEERMVELGFKAQGMEHLLKPEAEEPQSQGYVDQDQEDRSPYDMMADKYAAMASELYKTYGVVFQIDYTPEERVAFFNDLWNWHEDYKKKTHTKGDLHSVIERHRCVLRYFNIETGNICMMEYKEPKGPGECAPCS
jgi:hypothetical protein